MDMEELDRLNAELDSLNERIDVVANWLIQDRGNTDQWRFELRHLLAKRQAVRDLIDQAGSDRQA